jgi:hypothetical protein
MALILMGMEGFFEMNWLVYSVGGTFLGALGGLLTSPAFLVRDWGLISFFTIGLMDLPLVGGKFTWSNNWDSPSLVQD